jgi:hypothetical protein
MILGDASTPNKQFRETDYTRIDPGPYIAIVKDNFDPAKMGSLKVLIPSLHGSDEGPSSALIQVGYLSPFYGVKSANAVRDKSNIADYQASQHSYGMWMTPPDIDTRVMVIFVEGKISQGYWIGCVQEPYMNHMMPGIAASRRTQVEQSDVESASKTDIYGTDLVPASEVNRAGIEFSKITGTGVDNFDKPVHPFAETLRKQGLIQDTVRGTTSSSARRESPSAVFGISTPGRVDLGSTDRYKSAKLGPTDALQDVVTTRAPGHTFVMDDGDAQGDNTLIRLRTGSGHQLLMHDTAGVMYLANAAGSVWMEFSNAGTVDIYAKQGINIRSGGDMNFHSEGDINMYANRNIRIKANEHLGEDPNDQTPKGIISIDGSIINQLAGRAMNVTVDKGYYSLRTGMSIYTQAAGGNQIHQASGQVHLVGSQVHFNSMPVDPNLLQPLQRTAFFSASGTGTLEVAQSDVTPVLRGSVGVLSTDRTIPGMTGMLVPTHEPFFYHRDNVRTFTAEGKVEDSNRPGTLGHAEYRNSISNIPEIVMAQYEARLEKYLNSLGLGVTDVEARRKAAEEFTRNYTSIFPGARDPFSISLPGNIGISDVANQVVKRITGTQGLNLFKDQVFVNQAGVLYTLGDMGRVVSSLEANVRNIPGQLAQTAKNTITTTVGNIANNELRNLSRDIGGMAFSTAQDFFRGDGINTAALYDDLGQSVTGATSLVAGQGGLGNIFNTNVFEGVGRGVENVFGQSEIFKGNIENLFGKGVFGNSGISGINLSNLSADGIIRGVGQAVLGTGINIVTNQFRNIIAGEITSMTNVVGVYAKDAFGEVAKNVGDYFNFGVSSIPGIDDLGQVGISTAFSLPSFSVGDFSLGSLFG